MRAATFVLLVCACNGGAVDATGSSSSGSSGAGESSGEPSSSSSSSGASMGGSEESGSPTTGAPVDPTACWTDLEVGAQEFFFNGFVGGSEGISFGADGLLYVTADAEVWRLDAAGEASVFAEVAAPVGLARLADGGFIVAGFGAAMQPDGAIFRVDGGGAVSQIAVGIDDPNFVTIAPDGSALVSDDFDTRVFRVTLDGEVSEVLTVESPNGMAYSPDGQAFYVASTFTVDAQLTRFDVDAAGLPVDGSGLEILHLGQGTTPDGIAVSADNQVYVAANLAGEIWRVDGAASELQPGELVASLAYPASLAFGVGPDFDPCSLYVTQLAADGVVRVAVGVRGAPLYE
jgi:gluconolactonase